MCSLKNCDYELREFATVTKAFVGTKFSFFDGLTVYCFACFSVPEELH